MLKQHRCVSFAAAAPAAAGRACDGIAVSLLLSAVAVAAVCLLRSSRSG